MSPTDEMLMAYADGELDGAEHARERAAVEAALKVNADVARRIEEHRALRNRLKATFDPVLDEPVPDRLVTAVRGTAAIADLGRAREARATATRARKSWGLPQWSAIAASLVIGAIIGRAALQSPELSPIGSRDGHLVAQAELADALSNQLANTQPADGVVHIIASFKSKAGNYCRTFMFHGGRKVGDVGGLACRTGNEWNLHTLASMSPPPTATAEGGFRQAGEQMPASVLAAADSEISGDPLDSSDEARAKDAGWQ